MEPTLTNSFNDPLTDRGKTNRDPLAATTPLPGVVSSQKSLVRGGADSRFDIPESVRDGKTPQTARPKRVTIFPKDFFKNVIRAKCLECCGYIPSESRDCHGFEGYSEPCHLAPVRTRKLQRDATKKALKQAVLAECAFCLNDNPLWVCSSPNCALYPAGAGPAVAKREGQGAKSSQG